MNSTKGNKRGVTRENNSCLSYFNLKYNVLKCKRIKWNKHVIELQSYVSLLHPPKSPK